MMKMLFRNIRQQKKEKNNFARPTFLRGRRRHHNPRTLDTQAFTKLNSPQKQEASKIMAEHTHLHTHEPLEHEHEHKHDGPHHHHQHEHEEGEPKTSGEPHTHEHEHDEVTHEHGHEHDDPHHKHGH